MKSIGMTIQFSLSIVVVTNRKRITHNDVKIVVNSKLKKIFCFVGLFGLFEKRSSGSGGVAGLFTALKERHPLVFHCACLSSAPIMSFSQYHFSQYFDVIDEVRSFDLSRYVGVFRGNFSFDVTISTFMKGYYVELV